MQPVTYEKIQEIIDEAKKAGKDVSELEKSLKEMRSTRKVIKPPSGQKMEKTTPSGIVVIESTGPAREEDFKEGS